MRYTLLSLFALLTFAAHAQISPVVTDSNFLYKVTLDTPEQALGCPVKSITIIRRKDGRQIQEIQPDGSIIRCSFDSSDKQCFAVEDMNFDGYNDMRLLIMMSRTGHNLSYYYWTYDPKTKLFVEDTVLPAITEPEFDARTKTITSYYSNGNEGSGSETYELYKGELRQIGLHTSEANHYTGDYMISDYYYAYINGKRVTTDETTETFDEDKKLIITTTKKRVNGKLKIISVHKEKAVKSKY